MNDLAPQTGPERTWFEDDTAFAREVREALRVEAPVPVVPGCEDLREIGRGGQGLVYAAVQTATKRRVAVKVLHDAPGRTRSARSRFERELELVASLHDPRLVQVFDGGTTADGRPYVVMELVEGVRIDASAAVAAARAGGWARPAADAGIALVAEVCAGIDHAHRRGVIHRDLKPSNILVDAAGAPRVLDFGLAKAAGLAAEGFATTAGVRFVGSVPWSSPEQAEGRLDAVDVRSDVYALGATLYDLVTGRPPVPTDVDLRRALDAIVKEPPVAPARIVPRCDRDLEAVALKALEKDPERRYATAGEMAQDLRRLLAGEPIDARRETAWRALAKLARRRRRIAVVATVVAVLAAGVVGLTSWLWRRSVAETARAEGTLEFFLDAIGSVDPARDGADTRLSDALDRISGELDRRFADADPSVRLRFRIRLRDLFLRLGRYERGLVEAGRVSELAQATDPAPGTAGWRSRWNGEAVRAVALYKVGRKEEAVAAYRAAHEALDASFGARDHDTLTALAGAAQVLKSLGRLHEAEESLRGIVAATAGAASFEDGALARAMALDGLAALAEIRGRPADAEAPQREATALFAAVKGEDAPEALSARSNLANLLLTLGRPEEAVDLLGPVTARFRERSGAKHPMTLAAGHNFGVALLRAGRSEEAARVLREVHEARVEVLGAGAHETLLTLAQVAAAADRLGDPVEHERLLRALVEGRRALASSYPADYWNTVNLLAGLVREQGRAEDAEAMVREILPSAAKVLGEDHWQLALYRLEHGRCLAALGRVSEALPLIRSAADVLASRLGPSHENTLRARAALDRLSDPR